VNALLGGVEHIAVDSNSGDVYIVFGNRDGKTGNNRLSIERLTSDGAGGLKVASTAFVTARSQAALPSFAVARDSKGTVGLLYTRCDGIDASTKLPKFSVWLAQSDNHGLTFSDTQLESFLSPVGNNGNSRQRVLGDYQQLKAWGGTFYGVFAGNGVRSDARLPTSISSSLGRHQLTSHFASVRARTRRARRETSALTFEKV